MKLITKLRKNIGKKCLILNYCNLEKYRGLKGIIANAFHDTDCIYPQKPFYAIKFENNKNTVFINTCFVKEL